MIDLAEWIVALLTDDYYSDCPIVDAEVDPADPTVVRLARHALGLPNSRRRSYRNRFFAAVGSKDYREWRAMTDAGHALRYPWRFSLGDLFVLTRAAAEIVLTRLERLDPEDFPRV